MRAWTRRYLLPLHRWTGLCAGLLLLLVALTGAAMAFRLQLEPVAEPALLTAPGCAAPLPLDALVERGRAANPQAGPLRFIRLYGDAGATVRIRFDDGQWVYVDPCSGRVAGRQAMYGGFFGALGWLHTFGFAPGHDWVAGGVALLFAVAMLGAGIALWWPATLRALRAGTRLRPGLEGRARSLNLHRTVAFYAAPVLLASALTGVPQAFGWGQAPSPAAVKAPAGSHAPTTPLEQMWRQAQSVVPHPQKTQIRFPTEAGAPLTFEMVAQSAAHANALSYVRIDPYGGQVVEHVPYSANRVAHKAYLFAAALHYGWIGGVAVQLLLMFGALAVPVLAWTGAASFMRGRRQSKSSRQRAVAAGKTSEAPGS